MSTGERYPSETSFRTLVERLNEGVLALDGEGHAVYLNPSLAHMLGWSVEDLGLEGFFERLSPEARTAFRERLATRVNEPQESWELSILHKDGHQVLFSVSMMWMEDVAGPWRACAVFTDITERRNAERALKESEAKFRSVLENMQDVFYRTDNQGRMVLMSPSGARVLGYASLEEFQDKPIRELLYLDPADHTRFTEALSQSGIVTGFEETLRKKDGTAVIISTNSHYYRDSVGKVLGVEGVFFDITERRRAERALQEQEAMYRALVEHSHDGIFIVGGDRFIFVNPRATAIVGYSLEELYGMNLWDMVHPEERARVQENAARRVRGEDVPPRYNARILHKNGSVLFVELSLTKVSFGGQWVVLGTLRDITERMESEVALKNSEERYRLLVENQGEGVGYVDEEEQILFVNRAAEEILGRSRSAFTDAPNFKKIQNETRKRKAGSKSTYEMAFIRPDGERRQVLVTVTPHIDDGGKFMGALGIFRDITSIKQAEGELKRLSTAIEQASDAILVTDIAGLILYANPASEALLGLSRSRIKGQRLAELNFGEDEIRYRERWQEVIQGYPSRGRITHRHADGRMGQTDTTLSPVRDDDGLVRYVVVTSRDVTREAELESRLRHAQKMEAIGVLAGGIAHDFNNLLMPILGFSELALDRVGADQPKLAGYLSEIQVAGRRAVELVGQILLFSRQAEQTKRPLELHLIVKECLKLMRAAIPATIPIRAQVDEHCGPVLVDPSQIQQVVMNLCTNGYHAMREKGGHLGVSLDRIRAQDPIPAIGGDLPPGDYVRLRVSDSGCGMGPETQKQIFLPFFTTKGVGEGTGLGLSIVHGIVTGCAGGITVDSEVGRGSTFTVFLPPAGISEPLAQLPVEGLATGNETIMVVDDEAPIGQLLRDALEMLGYRVVVFQDSQEALAVLLSDPQACDLLLTDFAMPGITGSELADRVWEAWPGFPVLLMTGYSEDLDEIGARQMGFADLLRKPVPLPRLAKSLRRVLDQTAAGSV